MKVGDKLICKSIPTYWNDLRIGRYYRISQITDLGIYILNKNGEIEYIYNEDPNSTTYIYKYFMTVKEERLLKLKQLEHESR